MYKKNLVKDTVKMGLGSMAGLGAMGAMSSVPGMPKEAGNVSSLASTGVVLANVGQLSKTAKSVMPNSKYTYKKKHSW